MSGGLVKVRRVKVWGLGSAAAGFSRDKKSSSFQEHMKEFHSIPVHSILFHVLHSAISIPLPISTFGYNFEADIRP